MDLIKKLTGKNPSEYEPVAKSLVDNADVELFAKLVKQDDFLFDFIKENVAKRIREACNSDNYLNLLKFFKYYSPSYETVLTNVLYHYGNINILPDIKDMFLNGSDDEKAYCVKYFSLIQRQYLEDIISELRIAAYSDYLPLATNSALVLAMLEDEVSKRQALLKLNSADEFEQYEGIKFLINYGAKDSLSNIIQVMKKSGLSENIASEIPYLINFNEFLQQDFENAILTMCYILTAIPDITPVSAIVDFEFGNIFNDIIQMPLTSISATLLRIGKSKFEELVSNDEYLYDCDKNTKEEVINISNLLKKLNNKKLESYLYDELYEESDFASFVLDYVEEPEEIETMINSQNQTLVIKSLTRLKELGALTQLHKDKALDLITQNNLRQLIQAL